MRQMPLPLLKKILFIVLIVIAVLFVLGQCGCTEKEEAPPPVPPVIELPSYEPTVCQPPPSIEKEWLPEIAPAPLKETSHQKI